MKDLFTDRRAEFSEDETHRFYLVTIWNPSLPLCVFVMLNPSVADQGRNDNTTVRVMTFARDWGYGGVIQVNLFSVVSQKSAPLSKFAEPVRPENDDYLRRAATEGAIVIVAWGAHKMVPQRERHVVELLRAIKPLHCLRTTKAGHPEHPCYLPKKLRPIPFEWKEAA